MRNPFRIRASQRSVNDEEFVKLFGAGALQLLDSVSDPWSGVVFLRSAAGGGKTTFLRLLTPRPLDLTSRLFDSNPQVKATYDALRQVGAINEDGSRLLGTMVAFTKEYRELAEFDRANSLFRALLDSRIVIATLRAVMERLERPYPDDLHSIRFEWEPESGATIPGKANGRELFDWASEIEHGFYDRMDDLGDPEGPVVGHPRFDAFRWFARSRILHPSGELRVRRVLLLDELQTLAPNQRQSLTEFVTDAREACGIWIAERLEALTHHDLLSEGALEGRDYEDVIQLERSWGGTRARTYTKFVEQIASLRAAKAEGFESRDFFALLGERDDAEVWDAKFKEAGKQIEAKLLRSGGAGRYDTWIDEARRFVGSPLEQAIRWRSTEILVERDRARSQASFDFDVLSADEYDRRERGIERASEHFLRTEISAPLYFGRETLSAVSSSNVDQYLEVAGALFDEISAKIKGPRDIPMPLTSDRQDAIIRGVADLRWEGLTRRLPRGYEARRFLEGLGAFCHRQTFRATAPYAPGVTGFGITMLDRATLIDSPNDKVKHFMTLREVLTSLVAHHLLIPRLDHQNNGKSYVIFYLNRLLCVRFGLPLGYGGWREKPLRELHGWLQNGMSDVTGTEAGFV